MLVSVDNVGSNMGKMAPISGAPAEAYGRQRPAQHLADGGFAKFGDSGDLRAGACAAESEPRPARPVARRSGRDRDVARAQKTDAAKAIYKERAASVECANAQARNKGLIQFTVRGLEAVKAVALSHALTRNMSCSWRLLSV
jgi:hypothetical protein